MPTITICPCVFAKSLFIWCFWWDFIFDKTWKVSWSEAMSQTRQCIKLVLVVGVQRMPSNIQRFVSAAFCSCITVSWSNKVYPVHCISNFSDLSLKQHLPRLSSCALSGSFPSTRSWRAHLLFPPSSAAERWRRTFNNQPSAIWFIHHLLLRLPPVAHVSTRAGFTSSFWPVYTLQSQTQHAPSDGIYYRGPAITWEKACLQCRLKDR